MLLCWLADQGEHLPIIFFIYTNNFNLKIGFLTVLDLYCQFPPCCFVDCLAEVAILTSRATVCLQENVNKKGDAVLTAAP